MKNNAIAFEISALRYMVEELQEQVSLLKRQVAEIPKSENRNSYEKISVEVRAEILQEILSEILRNTSGKESATEKSSSDQMPHIAEAMDSNQFVEGIDYERAIHDYERKLISHALKLHNGTKSQAANYLNINRTTLLEKMKRLGLQH